MPSIDPTPESIADLEKLRAEAPVVMINFLRYAEAAAYAPDSEEEECGGREAYGRYGMGVAPLLAKAGARVVWSGTARQSVIAPAGEEWDDVILVEYPSVGHFLDMVTSPEYQAVQHHRSAALSDSRLIASQPTNLGG